MGQSIGASRSGAIDDRAGRSRRLLVGRLFVSVLNAMFGAAEADDKRSIVRLR
jgi:hypothetical protein